MTFQFVLNGKTYRIVPTNTVQTARSMKAPFVLLNDQSLPVLGLTSADVDRYRANFARK